MYKKINVVSKKIESKRLLLEPISLNEVDSYYQAARVSGVGESAGWTSHENVTRSENLIRKYIEKSNCMAIKRKVNHEFLGVISGSEYIEEELPREYQDLFGVELSFWLKKEVWNQGIMTEAKYMFLNYLFHTEALDFVICSHFEHNLASRKIIEKFGYTLINKVMDTTDSGDTHPTYVYILLKEHFEKLSSHSLMVF